MEEFKECKEYPGILVGNQGTIKQGDKIITHTINNGYKHVIFHIGLKRIGVAVHRILGLVWIPNPENKRLVDHINRDRTDYRLENLRWATHGENSSNMSLSKLNKSGVQGISYSERDNLWAVCKTIKAIRYRKHFKNKIDAETYLKSLPEH